MHRQETRSITATAYDGSTVYLWYLVVGLEQSIKEVKCWAESREHAVAYGQWAYQRGKVYAVPWPVNEAEIELFGGE